MDPTPTILLVVASQSRHADLRPSLEATGHVVKPSFFQGAADLSGYRLAVVDSGEALDEAAAFARSWFRTKEQPTRPLIWLADAKDQKARLASWDAGATACLIRPFAPAELQAQVNVLLRLEEECRRYHLQAQERNQLNESLLRNYQEHDADCRIAQRIQRTFQPKELPQVQQARFAVVHRSRTGMGGDIYSVQRVDDEHAAFYLGDVMGHGLTSSLLSIFIHRALLPMESIGQGRQLLSPEVVLRKVNREIANIGLPEAPVARLIYGVLNGLTGELRYACAGQTPPLYLPHEGEPECWPVGGMLLGLHEAEYPVRSRVLRPGDRVLLFTDGLCGNSHDAETALRESFARHRNQPLAGLLAAVTQELLVQTPDPDDFTMLGMEMKE